MMLLVALVCKCCAVVCLQIIVGLGGIGKSAVAACYANRFKDVYMGGVFYFSAESWAMLHTSLRQNVGSLLLLLFLIISVLT